MNRTLLLAVLFLGAVSIGPFRIAHASPVSTSLPGVKPGDNATYDFAISWQTNNAAAFPNTLGVLNMVRQVTVQVTAVSGANVTNSLTLRLLNGTSFAFETQSVDVQTQDFCFTRSGSTFCSPEGRQVPFSIILAAGLQAPNAVGRDPTITLNQTMTRTVLGAQRTLNFLNITSLTPIVSFSPPSCGCSETQTEGDAYDQASGILVQAQALETLVSPTASAKISVSVVLASTNIWATSSPDFSLTSNPPRVTLHGGESGSSVIILKSVNGFSGTVSLQVSSSSQGLLCTLSAASATLSPSGNSSQTVSCRGSRGTYAVTVTGTAGSLSHSTTITYTVLHGHGRHHL